MAGRGAAGVGREGVLAAALDLFSVRSVAGTSLQQIAEHLGVSKAAVYHHFRTKDAIVVAVLRPGLDQLREVVEVAARDDDPVCAARSVIGGLADVIITQHRRYTVMMADPAVGPALDADPEVGPLLRTTRELLLGRDPSARHRLGVGMFLGALNGPAQAVRGEPELHDLTAGQIGWDEPMIRDTIEELGQRLVLDTW